MSDSNLPVVCRGCGRTVTMSQINFDDDSKQYVCNACYNAKKKINSKPQGTEETKTNNALIKPKINYQCPDCKYKFSKPKDKPPKDCPYCGNKKVEIIDDSASRLLDESDEWG
ncbi:hydrogenase maturation nickel metallochaperone HypA [Candidatus Woesearchaeota archaeon]|nr:hydrogenase maturation nickel metallochaperone HypA [Candidatus Woesearchaeota archaeon]MCF7901097.1 hydrogenase maturation nickel metallochaperone HypA [Candidatus Woesearchaeota archaeon]MCF8013430.1 hydrogenase maturation nickel metallochaperone HypA [Candidatus Woesearchaeota archaeon]